MAAKWYRLQREMEMQLDIAPTTFIIQRHQSGLQMHGLHAFCDEDFLSGLIDTDRPPPPFVFIVALILSFNPAQSFHKL
jgi:hypothetical protein